MKKHVSHFDICSILKEIFFTFFDHFLAFFSTLPGTQTLKVISLIFFISWPCIIGLWKWISTLYILFKAFCRVGRGAPPPPPRLYIDSDPPAFTVLKLSIFFIKGNPLYIRNISTFYVRQRNWVIAPNSNFLISISFQPDVVNLWYLKLRLDLDLDLTDFIVWNI